MTAFRPLELESMVSSMAIIGGKRSELWRSDRVVLFVDISYGATIVGLPLIFVYWPASFLILVTAFPLAWLARRIYPRRLKNGESESSPTTPHMDDRTSPWRRKTSALLAASALLLTLLWAVTPIAAGYTTTESFNTCVTGPHTSLEPPVELGSCFEATCASIAAYGVFHDLGGLFWRWTHDGKLTCDPTSTLTASTAPTTTLSITTTTTTTVDPLADALTDVIVLLMRIDYEGEPEPSMNERISQSYAFLAFVLCPWIESFDVADIEQVDAADTATALMIELIQNAEGKTFDGTASTTLQYIHRMQVFLEESYRQEDPIWMFEVCDQLSEELPAHILTE
jgi:hypothetical protein